MSVSYLFFLFSRRLPKYIYVFYCFQIVVVFYVAIVLLLIGTNLRAGRMTRGARFKQHVVEFNESSGAANRLVPSRSSTSSAGSLATAGGGALIGIDHEDDVAEV